MQKNFTNILYITLDNPIEYITEMRKQYPDNDIRVLNALYENNVICEVATNKDINAINNIALSITKTGQEWF